MFRFCKMFRPKIQQKLRQKRDLLRNQFLCLRCRRPKLCCRCRRQYKPWTMTHLFPTTLTSYFVGYFLSALAFEIADSFYEKLNGISFSDSFQKCKEEGNFGFGVSLASLCQAIIVEKLHLTPLLVMGLVVKDVAMIRFVAATRRMQSCVISRFVAIIA